MASSSLRPPRGWQTSRGYRIDDNVLAKLARGIVLERTSGLRIRSNVFDGDGEGLVADSAARNAVVLGNIFLRAGTVYVRAPELDAGGNYWGSASVDETRAKVAGNIIDRALAGGQRCGLLAQSFPPIVPLRPAAALRQCVGAGVGVGGVFDTVVDPFAARSMARWRSRLILATRLLVHSVLN